MSTKTFHIDLNFKNNSGNFIHPLYLKIRSDLIPLKIHNEQSLNEAKSKNKAVALILKNEPLAFSHFANVPDALLSDDRVHYIKVVGPKGPNGELPHMYLQSYHCTNKHIVSHYNKKIKKTITNGNQTKLKGNSYSALMGLTTFRHPKLGHYGIDDNHKVMSDLVNKVGQEKATKQLMDIITDVSYTLTPVDIAVSILFQHPEVATNKPAMATVVQQDCILQTTNTNQNQYNAVIELATKISGLGADGWSSTSQSKDDNGDPVTAEYDLKGKDGNVVFAEGQAMYQYNYNPVLDDYIQPPLSYTTLGVRNTPVLQNHHWSVSHGVPSINTEVTASDTTASSLARTESNDADSSGGFTLTNKSPGHGISIDESTLNYVKGSGSNWGQFSIDAKNSYLRSIGVSVQFYDSTEMTNPIKNPKQNGVDWPSYYTATLGLTGLQAEMFETDSMKGVGYLAAVSSIMGIPLPADATKITMNWPEEAQAARLYFASIGTSNWIFPIVWPGVINTGIFQYSIPIFFLAAGAAVADTEFYAEIMASEMGPILQIAIPIVENIIENGDISATSILLKFSDVIVSMIAKEAFAVLATAIAAEIVAAEVEDSVPIVGEVIRIANMAIDAAAILVTTGEILASPAVIESSIKRQMTLDFTLHPDPAHGEPGNPNTAIWPLVGDHVIATITYTNGTNYEIKQQLPSTSSNAPLLFTYNDVGWGGQYKITANVYSKNGWLCGQYKSGLINAKPDSNNPPYTQTEEGNITEFLVPLTQDTQYQYKQKLAYDGSKHTWEVGTVPTATIADLSTVNGGNNLAQLVGITVNEKAYQAGYSYRAANQYIPKTSTSNAPTADQMYVFQNISILSEETLNERLKFSSVGFENQGSILYDTFGQGPDKDTISPYNFIIDSRFPCPGDAASGPPSCYYMRQVDLMNGKHDFGLGVDQSELKSYGKFTIPDLDAIVFHESGYAIAVSFNYGKVQILKINLDKGPVIDADAPTAVTLSAPGIAQGLTLGPKAMKVTPDGRILLLETINRRIQAFDVMGNPVPSFTADQIFTIDSVIPSSAYIQDLNNTMFSDDLKALFSQNGLAYISEIPNATIYTSNLDGKTLTIDLVNAFQEFGVFLTYNKDSDGNINPEGSTYIEVTTQGKSWKVVDPNQGVPNNGGPSQGFTYLLDYDQATDTLGVQDALDRVSITVKAKGLKWVVTDLEATESYIIEYDQVASQIAVSRYVSYFWLGANTAPTSTKPLWLQSILNDRFTYPLGEFIWNNIPAETVSQGWNVVEPIVSEALYPPFDVEKIEIIKDVTYLDIAVESKGYMYILYYKGDGTKNTDYFIDIYDPTGEFVVTTPDPKLYSDPDAMQYVAAARLTLDIWRNIFSLNFEKFQGPSMQNGVPGRTEPSISTWIPTPPDFTLPMTDLEAFQNNTSNSVASVVSNAVKALFSANDIDLSATATILRMPPADSAGAYSHFQITNEKSVYDIIVSLSYGGKTPSTSNDSPTQKIYIYSIIA